MTGSEFRSEKPKVTIIVPCRNEIAFIKSCLESIAFQDYPKENVEVLVVDGLSDDGTREIIAHFSLHHPQFRLIDNSQRITASGLNYGVKNAVGAYVLWMSAHNQYPPDYVSQCVIALEKWGADNVGGIIIPVPRQSTPFSEAILCVISHPFGVGNSKFRTHSEVPLEVDTVFGGCYRREVFDRIGLFNEKLVRGQDMEFNLRLKKAGGKIILVPSIQSRYFARTDFLGFCIHNCSNGKWAILPFMYSQTIPVSWRHLVPLLFVSSLLISVVLLFKTMMGAWFLLAILVPYVFFCFYYSIKCALLRREYHFFWSMPVAFMALHFFYGLGSLWGAIQVAGSRKFWYQLGKGFRRP